MGQRVIKLSCSVSADLPAAGPDCLSLNVELTSHAWHPSREVPLLTEGLAWLGLIIGLSGRGMGTGSPRRAPFSWALVPTRFCLCPPRAYLPSPVLEASVLSSFFALCPPADFCTLLPTRSIQQSRVVQECASLCPGCGVECPGSPSALALMLLAGRQGLLAGA